MKTVIGCIMMIIIMTSQVFAQQTVEVWSFTQVPNQGQLYTVENVANDVALVGGTQGISRSLNKGGSWTKVYDNASIRNIRSFGTIVYACGSDSLQGLILRSSDSGLSWQTVLRAPGKYFSSIYPASASKVYALYPAIGAGVMYRSTNSGTSWDSLFSSGEMYLVATAQTPTDAMLVVSPSTSWKSIDGKAWSYFANNGIYGFSGVRTDNAKLYMSGQSAVGNFFYPSYSVSSDGAENWTPTIFSERKGIFYDMDFKNGFGCLAGGFLDDESEGCIYKTSDRGAHWSLDYQVPGFCFMAASIMPDHSIFAVGRDGLIAINQMVTMSVSETVVPNAFTLKQNYPNPFNPTTKIPFSLNVKSHVSLKVHDVMGRTVATLLSQDCDPGEHEVEFNASNLPSGTYYYELIVGNKVETKKMVLVK